MGCLVWIREKVFGYDEVEALENKIAKVDRRKKVKDLRAELRRKESELRE